MARGAFIHRAATIRIVLSNVRRNLHVPQLGDEIAYVVTLVSPECNAVRAG